MYKIGMIKMLSNSLIEQLNVSRRTCHISMKGVSAVVFLLRVVWWGVRAASAQVSTGSMEASKARLGFGSHIMASGIFL
jgi:hypothetical protein